MPDVTVRTTRRPGQVPGGLPSIVKTVRSNSHTAAYNFARRTEKYAKVNVHVITGRLKASIHREMVAPGHHKVKVGAHYGVYEEYGTRYRPPHPYLRPAARLAKTEFLADMRDVFRVTLR